LDIYECKQSNCYLYKCRSGLLCFEVKGSNNDGLWNEERKSIIVIITPPWWKTNLDESISSTSKIKSNYRPICNSIYLQLLFASSCWIIKVKFRKRYRNCLPSLVLVVKHILVSVSKNYLRRVLAIINQVKKLKINNFSKRNLTIFFSIHLHESYM